jgi:hypothetical protein
VPACAPVGLGSRSVGQSVEMNINELTFIWRVRRGPYVAVDRMIRRPSRSQINSGNFNEVSTVRVRFAPNTILGSFFR